MDEDGFIKNYGHTAGKIHGSNVFEALLAGNEKEVYADSAYKSGKLDMFLKNKGTRNRVLDRAYRNKPLTDFQKSVHRMNSALGDLVVRVFGVLKLHYGVRKARFGLISLAYSIK